MQRLIEFKIRMPKRNNLLQAVFELPEAGGLNPLRHLADPPTSGQNSIPGGRVSTPHLSFAEVGMLLDSHFLLMQFLKYIGLHHDDLNVTTSRFILQTRVV